jgi:hypothetical protein
MQTLSYTISPVLQQSLKAIDTLRQGVVLRPLSPKNEHRFRWEANLDRIYYSLHLAHTPVSKKDIIRVLSTPGKLKGQDAEVQILQYKRGLDYISQEWLVNDKPVMPQTVQKLYKLVTGERLPIQEQPLMEILVFLQTSNENPFIQAYIGFLQFSQLIPASDASGKVARLLPYLFLYKAGFDVRGLLILEEYFYKNERLLRDVQTVIERKESVTAWIEHFVNGVGEIVAGIEHHLSDGHEGVMPSTFWQLTERQKEVLSLFDRPGERITNRKVQATFKISQITASRDLARMSALGYLFPYGKGRSVYYMKV